MRLRRVVWLCAFVLVFASCALAQAPTWDELLEIYAYDPALALNAVTGEAADRGVFTAQDVEFDSPDGGRVHAVFYRPKHEGPVPCVLFLHGLGGSRTDGQIAAMALAPRGVAVMAIDAQYHGLRKVEGMSLLSPETLSGGEPVMQTIRDNLRAVDYLAGRDDVDADRLALVGVSMGGILGSMVAALDTRLKGACLIVGGGRWDLLLSGSQHPAAQQLRDAAGDTEVVREMVRFFEPVHFIAHLAPRPLLMINGREDDVVLPECGEALYEASREPRRIVWYDGGHIPPFTLLLSELTGFVQDILLTDTD